jgi:hypothetical protein
MRKLIGNSFATKVKNSFKLIEKLVPYMKG